jgi:DNA-binding SARP family transcriptional activator
VPHIVRNNVRDESEAVRIWLLGGFRVSVGTRRTIGENDWRLKKAASLVKLLALEPGHRMHQEQIMESLWPELGLGAATNNLRQVLHFARRMLDPDPEISSAYLQRRGELLELCPETPSWVDVEVFEEAATVARHAGDPAAYRASTFAQS